MSFLQSADNQRKSISIPSSSESTATEDIRGEETDVPQLSDVVEPNDNESTPTTSVYTTPLSPLYSPPATLDKPAKKVVSSTTTKTKSYNNGNKDRFASLLERRDKERNEIFKHLVAEEEDDVDLLFKSIAKSVKRLRPDLRTQAKLQTLTLVANLENQMQTSHWVTNTSLSSPSTLASTYSATHVVESPPYTTISSVDSNIGSSAGNVLQVHTYGTEGDARFDNLLLLHQTHTDN